MFDQSRAEPHALKSHVTLFGILYRCRRSCQNNLRNLVFCCIFRILYDARLILWKSSKFVVLRNRDLLYFGIYTYISMLFKPKGLIWPNRKLCTNDRCSVFSKLKDVISHFLYRERRKWMPKIKFVFLQEPWNLGQI